MSDKSKNSVWNAGLMYGTVLGAISIIIAVIFYILGESMSNTERYVSMGVTVILLTYLLYLYRQEYLGGYANYGSLLGAGIIITVVAGIFGIVYYLVMLLWIDPNLQNIIDEKAMEQMLVQMDKRGITPSQDELDSMMEKTKFFRGPIFTSIAALIGSVFLGAVISALAAIFIKKENPNPWGDIEGKESQA